MTTRISLDGPTHDVSRTATAPRVTPPPARPFRAVMNASATAVVASAESAARRLPGGPILAAAFRSTPNSGPVVLADPGGLEPAEATPGPTTGLRGAVADLSTVPDIDATGGESMEQALSSGSDRTLQYLALQERISDESNAYTALSNVLKARHDTIKNAIGNIR